MRTVSLNNIENPVYTSIGSSGGYVFTPNKYQNFVIPITRRQVTLEDSLLGYYPPAKQMQVLAFMEGIVNSYDVVGDNYGTVGLDVDIAISENIYQYQRRVFNVFELVGTLGGIFEVFDIVFGLLIGALSGRMFKKELQNEILKAERQYLELKTMIKELK
jgi:hypothetical protein